MLEVTAFLSRQMPWADLPEDLLVAAAKAIEVHFIARNVRLTSLSTANTSPSGSSAAAQGGDSPAWSEGSLVVVRQGWLMGAIAYSGGALDSLPCEAFLEHTAHAGSTVFWGRSAFAQSRVPIAQWIEAVEDSLIYILPASSLSVLAKDPIVFSTLGVGLGPHLEHELDTLSHNANSASQIDSEPEQDSPQGLPLPALNARLDLGSAVVDHLEAGERTPWDWARADATVRDVIDVIGSGARRVVLPGDGTLWGLTERLVVGPDELMRWLAGPMPSDLAPAQSIASKAYLAGLRTNHMVGLLTSMAERRAPYALLMDNHDVSSVFSLEQIVARCDNVVDRLAARLAVDLTSKAPLFWAGPALVRLGCSNPLAASLLATWLHNTVIRLVCLDHENHKGRAPAQFAVVVPGPPAMLEMLPDLCQSHVIVHEPTHFSSGDTSWFVQLGSAIASRLEKAGFRRPDKGFVSSDPFWVQNTTTWRTWMDGWAARPDPTSARVARDFPLATTAYGSVTLTKDLLRRAEPMQQAMPALESNPGAATGQPDPSRRLVLLYAGVRELADRLWRLAGRPDVDDETPLTSARLLAVADTELGSQLSRGLLHDLATGSLWAIAKLCSAAQTQGRRPGTQSEDFRARNRDDYHVGTLAAILEQCLAALRAVN